MRLFAKFLADDSRCHRAIEYGLIAAGISLAIIAGRHGLGTNLNEKFTLDQQLAEVPKTGSSSQEEVFVLARSRVTA